MKKLIHQFAAPTSVTAALIIAATVVTPANAYSFFFGEDLNSSAINPLASFPNASAAEADFLTNLVGVGTETFENFAVGTIDPNLTFPTPSEAIFANINGNGSVRSVTPGRTNGFGRYATSGSKYFEAVAAEGGFSINFADPVAALGFFGVDIGDFGGQLQLVLADNTTTTLTIPNTISEAFGETDGSVLFYGLIADNEDETFTSVAFELNAPGTGTESDIFAFDDFTIGSLEQVNPTSIPESYSVIGLALSFCGVSLMLKRKQRKA